MNPMKPSDRSMVASRRDFLGGAAIASVAAVSGMAIITNLHAAPSAQSNRVKLLDLGVKPAGSVPGGVVLSGTSATFLTFKAVQSDDEGNYINAGHAVIELLQCVGTRFRYPRGEPTAQDSFLTDQLVMGEVYEVENSTWLKSVQPTTSSRSKKGKRSPATTTRHYVFTFFPTTFECLATELKVEVSTASYDWILASHGFL